VISAPEEIAYINGFIDKEKCISSFAMSQNCSINPPFLSIFYYGSSSRSLAVYLEPAVLALTSRIELSEKAGFSQP